MGYTAEFDFEVYKAITALRTSESVTENDVLRELLKLPPVQSVAAPSANNASQNGVSSSPEDWVVKGVRFPVGTDFRAKHKGVFRMGRVQGGCLVVDGMKYDSVSAAAVGVTKTSVNGWLFWECRFPGKSQWQSIESLRL